MEIIVTVTNELNSFKHPPRSRRQRLMWLVIATSEAVACLAIAPVHADQAAGGADRGHTGVTVVGCLKPERDVTGRPPGIAERVGIGESFVLTDVRVTRGASGSIGGTASPSSSSVAPTGSRYVVTGVATRQLRDHVNHQVALEGRFDDQRAGVSTNPTDTSRAPTPPPDQIDRTGDAGREKKARGGSGGAANPSTATGGSSSRSDAELPKFHATSIREVSATCGNQSNPGPR
jgi:hypothetical protein